jgi:hypothetical protein
MSYYTEQQCVGCSHMLGEHNEDSEPSLVPCMLCECKDFEGEEEEEGE